MQGVMGTPGGDKAQAQGTIDGFLKKSKRRLKIKGCQTREGDEEENCSRQWEQHVQRLRGKKVSV